MIIRIVSDHLRQHQFLYQRLPHGHTDQSFPVYCHKIHVFCCGKFRGADKISFVFPVLVVCYQYNLTVF